MPGHVSGLCQRATEKLPEPQRPSSVSRRRGKSLGEGDTSPSGREDVWFATENRHKFLEARAALSNLGIRLRQLRVAKPEIQSGDLEEIATVAVEEISKSHRGPLLVEDSGLFVTGLKGFPGPFSAYVHRTIGAEGVLLLMRGHEKRQAHFQASIAFSSGKSPPIVFSARVYGTIARKASGKGGFGFDPIFVPSGTRRTFADMGRGSKNLYSHRARAFRKFAKWYRTRQPST